MPIKAKKEKKNTPKDKPKKCNQKLIDECVRGISSLTIDEILIKFPVNFVMNDDIRQIELKNIVDKRLETLDPKPDIQILFKEYDKRYFRGILSHNNVEVFWSERLTSAAGQTVELTPVQISLSRKILKFTQRRHTVETLLHEMIHAYQFVTGQFSDEGQEHDSEFKRLMEKMSVITGVPYAISHDLDTCDEQQIRRYRKKFKTFCESRNRSLKSKGLIEM